MCVNCQTATQHFTDGSKPKSRDLSSGVQQGVSPDWGGRSTSSSNSSSDTTNISSASQGKT